MKMIKRMEIVMQPVTVLQPVKTKVTVYVADDGKTFDSEQECKEHEEQLLKEAAAEKFLIPELTDLRPPVNSDFSDCSDFFWYKVNTPEEFEILNVAYYKELDAPSVYPETVCVEKDEYNGIYSYNLSDCKKQSDNFWDKFGYRIIEK